MDQLLKDLINVLTLERLEMNLFRGQSRDIGSPQVFGGQVLGQALKAATATVEERVAHSLHAYFLRRGDFNAPIVYEVDRALDGKHFSSRRVVAIQYGRQIFNMSASFQAPEQGLEHQQPPPSVPPPEQCEDLEAHYRALAAHMPPAARRALEQKRPFEFRPVPAPSDAPAALKYIWFRSVGALPDDEALHRCMLAYVSDYHLLETALRPHGVTFGSPGLLVASIDHAMWFHRRVRVDDWLLYAMESPSASGARGFARGSVYSRDGHLISSAAQEGLIRMSI